MRVLRFVALAASLLLAAMATQLMLHLTLAGFFPDWLIARAPRLAVYAQFRASDLLDLAQWMAIFTCLIFGLAIPTQSLSLRRKVRPGETHRPPAAVAVLLATAFVAAILLALFPRLGLNGWVITLVWLAAIALVVLLAELLERERSGQHLDDDGASPEQGWPWLVAVLAIAGILFAWRLGEYPLVLPAESVGALLQAQDVAALLSQGPVAQGSAGIPLLATAWSALWQALPGSPFFAAGMGALFWGLGLIAATWLLSCELLRSAPDSDEENAQGGGRMPPLVAALIASVSLAAIHYARLPLHLEGLTWATLGLWALIRAVRTGSLRLMALGGVCTGLSLLHAPTGILLLFVAMITWVGLLLWRIDWLRPANGGAGWRGFLLWAAAVAVTAAPFVCSGACLPQTAIAELTGDVWSGLVNALGGLGLPLAGATSLPLSMTIVGALAAPLLLLSIGAVVMHLDQMSGWVLLAWMLMALWAVASRSAREVHWTTLLIVLPAAAIASAFAFDRLRAGLALSLGTWSRTAVNSLAAGLLLLAAVIAWKEYPGLAYLQGGANTDPSVAVARWIASQQDAEGFVVAGASAPQGLWDLPVIKMALAGRSVSGRTVDRVSQATFPADLAPGDQVLVLPGETETLRTVQQILGAGRVETWRDHRGNPLLHIYTVARQE